MKQGEVWLVDLDPTRGAEIQKKRPVIIVNDNGMGKLPLKIGVPITDWKERYDVASWMVQILPNQLNGLSKDSAVDCFQIRSLLQDRFVKRLGVISGYELDEIKDSLKQVLSL
jgi:mRNA interferase MazF